MADRTLEIDGLTKRYGDVVALQDLRFEVRWEGAPMTFEARRRIGYMPEERGLYPKVRLAEQLAAAGLDPASVAAEVAQAQVQVRSLQPPSPLRSQEILVGFAVAYIFMFSLSFYGAYVAQGVVEETATRIVEIVLATVRPGRLLAGRSSASAWSASSSWRSSGRPPSS